MPNTTQPWLEDLSEEWVPQHTPPTLARNTGEAGATQTSQSVPAKPRSRLPRLRQSSGSFSEIQVSSKGLQPPKRRSILAERSLSENNIAQDDSPSTSHSISFVSQGSGMYGTVAHNTVARSPTKEPGSHNTPEWRRRLVKGELGYGDQTDLFGNTGLQNIFQKPTTSPPQVIQSPKRKLDFLKGMAAISSSPPAWPAPKQQLDNGHAGFEPEDDRQDSPQDDSIPEPEESSVIIAPRSATRDEPRTVSGQIEFENESFSPVYLTTNLKIGQSTSSTATATAVPNFRGSELANRLRQIGSPPPSQYESIAEESTLSHSREDSSFARLQDESLPEGLPAGTPDMADVGKFVEFRRGGYSQEGSFRHRKLSSSPEKELSSPANTIAPPTKTQTTRSADARLSPPEITANPKTPRRHFLSPEHARNSGSPLKLFDAHDTFTSNRLQRRLSQLEYKPDKTPSEQGTAKMETTRTVQKTSTLTSVEEVSIHRTGVEPEQVNRRVSSFGQGQLNQYQFAGEFSEVAIEDSYTDESVPDGSPSMDVTPPGSRQPFRFHVEDSPVQRKASETKRQGSNHSLSRPKFQRHRTISAARTEEQLEVPHEYADGKRGPTSPFKNPTSKRRRTIPSADDEEEDITYDDNGLDNIHQSQTAAPSVVGRKRKDARYESNSNVADPNILAQRHILRPRNPTPSQRRLDELQTEIMEATEAFIMSSPKLNSIKEQLEPSSTLDAETEEARAIAVASQVAAFSMKKQKAVRNETRKRSVTTQDFLDEAVKIMNFIRTKGRPSNDLGSLEETEAESEVIDDTEIHPSSSLTFERPPTREGRESAWKEPNKPQLDPNIMSHLQKYQEKDTDTFLNSSVNSLRISRVRGYETPEDESVVVEQDDIRITDNRLRNARAEMSEEAAGQQMRSNGMHLSTGSSLGHTTTTNASRRSDHVATLAPEAVAHLIPHQIAGMSFDREKNMWVRQKSPSKELRPREEQRTPFNDSEEDPFNNIPDLTVDDTIEQGAGTGSPVRPQPTAETILEDTEPDVIAEEERPETRDGKGTVFTDTSSVPSKASNFGWSYPKTDTRASSWSTQAPRNWSTHNKTPYVQTTYAIPESDEEDIEHEIQYYEGRGRVPVNAHNQRVRDITISIAQRDFGDGEQNKSSPQKHRQTQWPADRSNQKVSGNRTQKHHHAASSLPPARTSRAPVFNGDGDLSLLDEMPGKNYRMQLSMSVSAPILAHGNRNALAAPSSPMKGDVTFMLSDLPEFTLNQIDEFQLPDRVVVKHDGTRFSKALEDRYAQGTAELVKALQDVEPDEPYWEDLRKVDLHGKSLNTLHRLDELCYQLEELNVSDNGISQVSGIPYTMRRLQAQNNCLHGLTSWTTLLNLQHLDVSNNEIDSLDGLAELVHLRVLVVKNNKIKSLDSIMHLDGLMELNASGNEIEEVDFGRSDLYVPQHLSRQRHSLTLPVYHSQILTSEITVS
jgi:hypothetical protein